MQWVLIRLCKEIVRGAWSAFWLSLATQLPKWKFFIRCTNLTVSRRQSHWWPLMKRSNFMRTSLCLCQGSSIKNWLHNNFVQYVRMLKWDTIRWLALVNSLNNIEPPRHLCNHLCREEDPRFRMEEMRLLWSVKSARFATWITLGGILWRLNRVDTTFVTNALCRIYKV